MPAKPPADQLRQFLELERFSPVALEGLARHARRLRVPAGRWLVRPGRGLAMRVFLLEGRVRLLEPGRSVIVAAGSARARRAVYPGPAGVETLTPAVFLSLEAALLDGAGNDDGGAMPGVPEVSVEEPSWQRRFLVSPLMQRLDPRTWQRILRAMTTQCHGAGETVIEVGAPAECCYVLASGRAEIRSIDGGPIAVVEPGGLFGEDALASGRARNATVVMISAGSVVSLAADRFQALLLDRVVRPLATAGDCPVISLEPGRAGAQLCVAVSDIRSAAPALSPRARYAVVGGSWPERTLAAFLLAEQGIDASPVR